MVNKEGVVWPVPGTNGQYTSTRPLLRCAVHVYLSIVSGRGYFMEKGFEVQYKKNVIILSHTADGIQGRGSMTIAWDKWSIYFNMTALCRWEYIQGH